MKKWYNEDYSFKITVIDGQDSDCRNGHEIGDEYTCEYNCPDGVVKFRLEAIKKTEVNL